ncbi:histidinol dehydrogenase [Leucobacter japonicus]|uniref:histidinol dehydrogenase n=1 Tax=Leucobacter japonicus TaxID=1461259 RepID=UPI000AE8BB09|nr:histidinol dehydrogenase [Leucobacter japonicus]
MAHLRITDLRGTDSAHRYAIPRAATSFASATDAAAQIIADVRARGIDAVREITARFDRVEIDRFRVPQAAIDRAWTEASDEVRGAISLAIERVTAGHRAQLPTSVTTELATGALVHQRYLPVRRVGLYAPGGLAAYASSVIMNVIPAQVAGVTSIAVVSPPNAETGLPADAVLAACAALGVTEVYGMGGAQAIAALAYGLPDAGDGTPLEAVDVITGPGNVFVAAAKNLVRADVGIDAVAGPTEIMIVADAHANPRFVAADLLSQAEHDPNAASVLVTDSEKLANAVQTELAQMLPRTAHAERAGIALEAPQSGIVLVDTIDDAVVIANRYGAEHLEIHTERAADVAATVTNAGAVFVGEWSPVSLGDYCAGSNHVLPTSGTSRFTSGLSALTFLRPVQFIEYTRDALAEVSTRAVHFAETEGLPAHGEAVSARFA